jgi:hypothetical protein
MTDSIGVAVGETRFWSDEMSDPVLCYVRNNAAVFTTQPIDKQWGDDWDDAPYEHNAGWPYGPAEGEPWELITVYFDADLVTPDYNCFNSGYSVQSINGRAVAWLRDPYDGRKNIHAGTTLNEFKRKIREFGGKVFVEEKV